MNPANPCPQCISLSKIHDLPGVFITRQPDKAYGGLVSSILSGGVREPVILRRREDGEYQLVTGYRRLRASELAKLKDILALVYDMTMQEAIDYHRKVKNLPDLPVPGKLMTAQAQEKAPSQDPASKKDEKLAEPVKDAAQPVKPMAPTGPAARGPAGTAITQVFPERLAPPDEKALKDLPVPKEGESFFITLHPDYLEKSKFNKSI